MENEKNIWEPEEKDKEIFKTFVFPHICYLADTVNRNPYNFYKIYIGNEPNLTNGETYQFHYSRYSPNRETPYKLFMVALDNNGKYVRFEDNESNWK